MELMKVESIINLMATLRVERQKQIQNGQSQILPHVDCEICNGNEVEVVWNDESNDWLGKVCSCKTQKSINRMFKKSGIEDLARSRITESHLKIKNFLK